jgi:hypothetical protein
MQLNEFPAETKDGKLISLKGNIEVPEEVDSLRAHGAEGIGLYRSEFLFLNPGRLPSEESQYDAYSRVLMAMGGKSVTIRTLDLGGDKIIPDLVDFSEKNPLLGWRGHQVLPFPGPDFQDPAPGAVPFLGARFAEDHVPHDLRIEELLKTSSSSKRSSSSSKRKRSPSTKKSRWGA